GTKKSSRASAGGCTLNFRRLRLRGMTGARDECTLNALGFHYYLGEGEAGPTLARRSKQPIANKSVRHVPKDAPCPICNFRTDRPHDRRSHRMQKRKRPFNNKELEAMGMTRGSSSRSPISGGGRTTPARTRCRASVWRT